MATVTGVVRYNNMVFTQAQYADSVWHFFNPLSEAYEPFPDQAAVEVLEILHDRDTAKGASK